MDPSTEYLNYMSEKSSEREGPGSIHNAAPKLGSGKRFANLKKKIAAKGNVDNPAAVAAAIGRKKYGKEKFQKLAAEGRKNS